MYNIPLSVPSMKGNEWKYVKECIDTEWASSAGKYVELFEEKIVIKQMEKMEYPEVCLDYYRNKSFK